MINEIHNGCSTLCGSLSDYQACVELDISTCLYPTLSLHIYVASSQSGVEDPNGIQPVNNRTGRPSRVACNCLLRTE